MPFTITDLSILFGLAPAERRNMQSIQVGFGKANFPTASVTIAGFVVEPEFIRTLASKKLGKDGRTIMIPVSDHPQVDGYLYSERIYAPEDTVILIQTSTKQGPIRVRDGSIFVRVREDGAALLITAHIPHHARCTLRDHNHVVFSGNGDILSVNDLSSMGIDVPKNYVNAYMDPEELEETYTVVEIHEAVRSAPKVEVHEKEDGTLVSLKVDAPVRRMRIRR